MGPMKHDVVQTTTVFGRVCQNAALGVVCYLRLPCYLKAFNEKYASVLQTENFVSTYTFVDLAVLQLHKSCTDGSNVALLV